MILQNQTNAAYLKTPTKKEFESHFKPSQKPECQRFLRKFGAGEGLRTLDPNLGKGATYAASLGIVISVNRKNQWLRGARNRVSYNFWPARPLAAFDQIKNPCQFAA